MGATATPAATIAASSRPSIREHYGCIGPHPWAMGPHTAKVLRRGRVTARKRVGPGWSSRPRWSPTA